MRQRRPRPHRDRRRRDGADARARHLPDVRRLREPPGPRPRRAPADLAPLDDPRIFLGSGGGDAIDTAAKLARRYFAAIGTPERTHLISRSQGYHGTHGMGTSIGGIPANREDVGPLDPDASQVPHDSLEALEAEIERVGAERVAAVFVEPVIGAGGVPPAAARLHRGRRRAVRAHRRALRRRRGDRRLRPPGRRGSARALGRAARHDHLRQGRHQRLPAARRRGRRAPGRGAVLGRGRAPWFRHGPTYSGHPTVLRGRDREPRHHRARGPARPRAPSSRTRSPAALPPLGDHPLVGEVRAGIGALGAIAFAPRRWADATGPFARVRRTPASAACWCARWATASRSRRR